MNKECSFEGCGRQAKSKGLCDPHRQQQLKGQELRPVRVTRVLARPAPHLKVCTKCDRVKRVDEDFYKRRSGSPLSHCKECMKAAQRERQARSA